jgi:hypothetical protein
LGRPESIQWQHRRWLGDQRVLGMDWDAKAMHFHLLMMSIQEEPPGSIPDDMALIRRWLGSPSEEIWRRVRPQVLSAWTLRTDRWFNTGMVGTFERKERFNKRYENGTKTGRESPENQDNSNRELDLDSKKSESKAKPSSIQEIAAYCEERNKGVNPEAFWDFYESKGWKVGNQAMKDWRAAVRNWEKSLGGNGNGSRKDRPAVPYCPPSTCPMCLDAGTLPDKKHSICPAGCEAAIQAQEARAILERASNQAKRRQGMTVAELLAESK